MIEKNTLADAGDVRIHNNAIISIAKLTAKKVEGVVRISKPIYSVVLEKLGLARFINIHAGIKVESSKSNTKIILDIIAAYGTDISEVATRVQEKVKQAVEDMTGIPSVEVYVNVAGVEA